MVKRKNNVEYVNDLDLNKQTGKKQRIDNLSYEINIDNIINGRRNVPKVIYTEIEQKPTSSLSISSSNKLWDEFNKYVSADDVQEKDKVNYKEYVSATKVKNFIMKDPCLDWYELYYATLGFNIDGTSKSNVSVDNRKKQMQDESKNLQILFEMGLKFEEEVMNHLRTLYPTNMVKVAKTFGEIVPANMDVTWQHMKNGVPIIEQAVLYNHQNKTFGCADLLVRSDWFNKIFDERQLEQDEEHIKAPNLNGKYHYRVIDVKWTTMHLCSDKTLIRNAGRFGSYKGQLAIYTAAVGLMQGYTPNKAYILAKSWKYDSCNELYEGFNCFSLLGHIDYSNFDNKYLALTKDGTKWIRNVRYNGHKWTCVPPSVPELYPDMCNKNDTPYHGIKKEHAAKIDELTQLWMVGAKNRNIAHQKNIYCISDTKCTAKNLGINGKKIGPVLDEIIKINQGNILIKPDYIKNNDYDWQEKDDLDFVIDFETTNGCFMERNLDLFNSRVENNQLFLIGAGYTEVNDWNFMKFHMNEFTYAAEERMMDDFVHFVETKVSKYMEKNNIINRLLCYPKFFHWGNAEQTIIRIVNSRHNGRWTNWIKSIIWVDFNRIFLDVPIVIKGAKKFGLKEVAKAMFDSKMIKTSWDINGPDDGLAVMMQAIDYYKNKATNKPMYEAMFNNIIKYNEIDCKVLWEIINYLRLNHCKKTE